MVAPSRERGLKFQAYIFQRFIDRRSTHETEDLSTELLLNIHVKLDRYTAKLNEYGKQG